MAKFANALRLKIQAYASSLDPEDNILYAKVNYSLSKLMGMSAPNAMAACNTILKLTEEHETALIPFGVQPTDSLIMTDLIQDFVSKMTMPRQGIAELKGLTARIKEDVSYIDSLISKRMGKLMINFVQSAPVFYNNFMNFKRPVAGPTHFTELDIFTKNKQTGEPLKGVFITAVGTTKTYRGKSETSGELPLKKIAPELYDIVFEFPGFQPLTLNAQKAIIGEQVKIIAELIPIS